MSVSRRHFLAGLSAGSCLAMPEFLRNIALAAPAADRPGSRQTALVVIQLTGGNDGLNTVVPFKDSAYAAARPKLKLPTSKLHRINDELALAPSLGGFSKLLERSELAIVQGVGYPNPNRSHFASMDIWHKATPAKQEQYGWLGRALTAGAGSGLTIGGGEPPLALFSATGHAPALNSLDDFRLRLGDRAGTARRQTAMEKLAASSAPANPLLELARQSARQSYQSARRLQESVGNRKSSVKYPQTGLANRLKLIAGLIAADVPDRVFYTSLAGFDTHAAQADAHPRLLSELGDAVAAFQSELREHGHDQRVLTVTFSEFGRRVKENGSEGTDHGAASQMFLIGPSVRSGPIGAHPSLTDLHNGDLKFHTDFRSVYATVLEDWLGVEPGKVLQGNYPKLPLLQS